MEFIIKTLLFLHVVFGFISLVLFWLPVFLAKGGKAHRIVGKLYVFSMWIVVGTAASLSVKNVIIGKYFMASFLGFISLITANPLWYGTAILNRKKVKSTLRVRMMYYELVILLFSIALLGAGFYGIWSGNTANVLLFIFGGLGLTAAPTILKLRKAKAAETDRVKEHMIGLLTSGIAAYTAFFVFGGYTWMEKILPGTWQVLPWVAPGVLGAVGITLGVRYYRKKGMIKDQLSTPQPTE